MGSLSANGSVRQSDFYKRIVRFRRNQKLWPLLFANGAGPLRNRLYWPDMRRIARRPKSRPALRDPGGAGLTAAWKHPAWRTHTRRMLWLWALIVMAYSNSFQSALVFDNGPVITQDPRIRAVTAKNVEAILTGQYWYINSNVGLYRPLTTLSYLLNYAALGNGIRPAGYHWINVALHAANVTLVYGLGMLIWAAPEPAWALAAIWGLHPLLTEAVTNIVGRADLLAAFGVLMGLLCHGRAIATTKWRRVAWLAALVAAQTVGLFSKENAAVLPILMLLFDFTSPRRAPWRKRAFSYTVIVIPLAAFLCLSSAITHMQIDFVENPLIGAGFWTARMTAVKVMGKLMWLFVWPYRLSADYSYNAVPLFAWQPWRWEDAKALLALVACLCAASVASFLALRRRRVGRPAVFFLGFFFLALAPTSNVFVLIGSIMAERFMYLPSVGLAGCVMAATYALSRLRFFQRPASGGAAWAALGVLLFFYAARTYARNFDWQDARSLWKSAAKVSPLAARAHYNLGRELAHVRNRLPDAVAEFQAALKIRPDFADAYNNLGDALSRIPGRLPEAIAAYRSALRLEPNHADAHNNLGDAFASMPGHLPEAIAEFRAALLIEPGHPKAHTNLANALMQIPGGFEDAIAEYEMAVRLQPDNAEAHNNLGDALARVPGRLSDAVAEYQAALSLEPDHAEGHYNLGNALARAGRLLEAATEYEAALRLDPNFAAAHSNLGNVLAQIPGRLNDAIAEYRAALRLDPDFAPAHYNLGEALAQTPGGLRAAIAEYEVALRLKPDPHLREMLDRLRASRLPAGSSR
jgi:tetratricopeptide (TPR) repeat protein